MIVLDRAQNKVSRPLPVSGLLYFLAGSVILMGIITAEIFYPVGYTTADSEISDLGATRPPDSIIYQPSASIFNATMMSGGLLILAGSFFLFRGFRRWIVVLFPALLGIGVLGVGIFPGNMAPFHGICALVAFIAGGLSALISNKVTPAPFSYVLVFLGLVTLVFFIFLISVHSPARRWGNRTVCCISRGHLDDWIRRLPDRDRLTCPESLFYGV